jgi:alpha-beta hydrolase superfamily lysophospholipase/SAM-dependent methyltransferase
LDHHEEETKHQRLIQTRSQFMETESTFSTFDGTSLTYRHWPSPDKTNGAVIFLHRGHEHSGRIGPLVQELNLKDMACFAYDLRGHGKSLGKSNETPTMDGLVRDLQCFVDHLRVHHSISEEKIWIVANSLSSVIACAWVLDYAPRIRGLILAAPAFKIRLYVPFALAGLRMATKLMPRFEVKSYVRSGMLTHDPEQGKLYDNDPLITRGVSGKLLVDLFDTARRVIQCARFIHVPVLILSAEKDWVVSNAAQKEFFSALSQSSAGTLSRLVEFKNFFHAILFEKERSKAFGEIRAFIKSTSTESKLSPPQGALLELQTTSTMEQITFGLQRMSMATLGRRLSKGIELGHRTGYSSGETLDYVYRNQPDGFGPFGRAIDRAYLEAIGWRGVRERRVALEKLLCQMIKEKLAKNKRVVIMDLACGGGRYLLSILAQFKDQAVKVILADYESETLELTKSKASDMGLSKQVVFHTSDIYRPETWFKGEESPDIIITSGIYELCTDLQPIAESISAIHKLLGKDGYYIYTNQPWHPELKMIATTLHHRRGEKWRMNYRPQYLLDSIVRDAGFEKAGTVACVQGIFTVNWARKSA